MIVAVVGCENTLVTRTLPASLVRGKSVGSWVFLVTKVRVIFSSAT